MIYRLSTDQIVIPKNYQTVPVPEDLVDTICKSDLYENKSQVNDVDTILSIVHDDQSENYNDNDHTPVSSKDQHLQETNKVLQSSLLTSLQSKFLRPSLLASLQYGFLQTFLLASLRYGFLQSSLLVSL